jgi:hypothetical protein
MASVKVHQKFKEGLTALGISENDLSYFKYCGGNKGSHKNYFLMQNMINDAPLDVEFCICGHKIKEQCYLADIREEYRVLSIGNCCIKRFIPVENQGRQCERCGERHRNRSDNLCNGCRSLCTTNGCNNTKAYQRQICQQCINRQNNNKSCVNCGRPSKQYIRCFSCNKSYQEVKNRVTRDFENNPTRYENDRYIDFDDI